eukprot:CAMPEP_0179316576 /NCGR_PEP_ID=MMETSP0797-20121207/55752_1 /TAXON_ID=47934 /ORGANISM="Dinophysis acuminata, Strain DAEP01" /LENGTH=55 /DNA_ID=CAMNT_0021027343 /DNA_START=37 /DNA_END=201 /DNA_ORIENTATION=+
MEPDAAFSVEGMPCEHGEARPTWLPHRARPGLADHTCAEDFCPAGVGRPRATTAE